MNQAENLVERVKIVNEKNEFVEYVPRKEMRARALCHQGSFIILINSSGLICSHLRHKDKLWCGGYWTTCFGGCISEGEDYDSNAQKELEEEAGLSRENKLEGLECFLYSTEKQKVWGKVYFGFYDGEVNFQKEEIQDIKWRTVKDIKQHRDEFTPDGNVALDVLLKYARSQQDKYPQFKLLIENE